MRFCVSGRRLTFYSGIFMSALRSR